MGVERSVTRWYLQRQMILNEIASLEERLGQTPQNGQRTSRQEEQATLRQQLADAHERLRNLGACPKPMMG
jgi:hypothetical protein